MASIGKVSAVFTASTSGLTSGVNRASRSMEQLQRSMRGVQRATSVLAAIQVGQVFAGIARTVGSYTSSLIDLGRQQAQVIDRQSKLAQAIGLADAELAAIGLAGELAGVSLEQVGSAANRLNITLGKASSGNKAAQKAFSDLGLSVEQLEGLSAADQFAAIAQAISQLPTQAERAAAAVAIFGRTGAELLPLFAGGAAGIQAAAEQAERLGLALTNEQANSVEAMNDALTLVSKAFSGITQQVVSYLAPVITQVATTFTEFIGTIGGANIGQAIGEGILTGARFLAQVGDTLISYLAPLFTNLSQVGVQWDGIGVRLQQVAAVFRAVFDSVVAGFLFVIRGLGAVSEGFAKIVSYIPGLGALGTSLREAAAAFNENIDSQISGRLASAAENLDFATSTPAAAVGEAMAGPLTSALDAAVAQADAAAAGVTANPIQVDATSAAAQIQEAFSQQAVAGIDSRSSEGVREMFRLMRGNGAERIQEEQRDFLAQIAANTAAGATGDLAIADF